MTDGKFNGKVDLMFTSQAKAKYVASLNLPKQPKLVAPADGCGAIHQQVGSSKLVEIIAFGDTSSDFPLFEAATYRVLVDPTAETEEKFKDSIDEIIRV